MVPVVIHRMDSTLPRATEKTGADGTVRFRARLVYVEPLRGERVEAMAIHAEGYREARVGTGAGWADRLPGTGLPKPAKDPSNVTAKEDVKESRRTVARLRKKLGE